MECNKDEAIRAKDIAEKKLAEHDFLGAKKFAEKAQKLYPGLENVSELLTIIEVHIAAEKKIDGEVDWYGILGVDPQADNETLRKQYRKFARLFHPDKNKSVGAEGAFKHVSEAWMFLSDKGKKEGYDQKRRAKDSTEGGFSTSPGAKKVHTSARSANSNARSKKNSTQAGSSSAPKKQKSNTFWTVCRQCKVRYEYLRIYLNHNLLCPNCNGAFFATETSPPAASSVRATVPSSLPHQHQHSEKPSKFPFYTQRDYKSTPNGRATGHSSSEPFNNTNFQWSSSLKPSGASSAAQAATIIRQAYEQVKREREEARTAMKREEVLRRKCHNSKRTADDPSPTDDHVAKRQRGLAEVQGYRSVGVPESSETKGNDGTNQLNGTMESSYTRDSSQIYCQNLLKEKTRMEIRKKLNDCNFAFMAGAAAKELLKVCKKEVDEKTSGTGGDIYAEYKLNKSLGMDNGVHCKPFPEMSDACTFSETLEAMAVTVVDPDFYVFDKDRTESSFQENQIWAVYDNDDGMPRYYAMIQKVISLSPFKMQISWLNSKTNYEFGALNWVCYGYSKTCGEFRLGKSEITGSLASFSHKVRWTKGAGGVMQIYPKMGEVWALYRNWSPHWNELTADEVIHKYDMVEILEDCREELGVTVVPLVKIAGFKTVFRRHFNPGEVRSIPRAELFRFSHQVPYNLLVDQEAPSALNGCLELDPAATPMEFLQVIADVKKVEVAEVEDFSKEPDIIDSTAKDADMKILDNSGKSSNEQKGGLRSIQEVKIEEVSEKTALA